MTNQNEQHFYTGMSKAMIDQLASLDFPTNSLEQRVKAEFVEGVVETANAAVHTDKSNQSNFYCLMLNLKNDPHPYALYFAQTRIDKGEKIRIYFEPYDETANHALRTLKQFNDLKPTEGFKERYEATCKKMKETATLEILAFQILDDKNNVKYQLAGPKGIFLTEEQAKY